MRRSALLAAALLVAMTALAGHPAPVTAATVAAADDGGVVRGKIVLERGRLGMPLSRAVRLAATDFDGNAVGRVRTTETRGVLKYEITNLPLGSTLFVELFLRRENFPETTIGSDGTAVPTLARNDHSSPVYAFVLTHAAPRKGPLDFRVAVLRDPAPATVSLAR